jgi:hypothetical protein
MSEERDIEKIYKWQLIASGPDRWPKMKWMDNVMKDIRAMSCSV